MNQFQKLPPWLGPALTLGVILLIGYGSLYPFDWRPLPEGRSWTAALFAGLRRLRPGGRGDLLANLLLYLPLGAAVGLALRGRLSLTWSVGIALLLGGGVSLTVETLQLFDHGRDTRGSDVLLNVIGSGAGIGLAGFVARLQRGSAGMAHDGFALVLVAAWLGAKLFPYVPSIDLQAWKNALKPLLLAPTFDPVLAFCSLAFWLLAAEAVAAAIGAARLAVPAVLLGALAAKIIIIGGSLTLSETLGVLLALAIWFALSGMPAPRRAKLLLAPLLLAVLIDRLAPFNFGPAQSFGLVPFRSFLDAGGFGAGVQSGLTKLFLYGGLIWLACRAGFAQISATGAVVLLALLASLMQIWLPGRSAEVTDAIVAGLAGITLIALAPGRLRARSPY